jgi:hypothetical protein
MVDSDVLMYSYAIDITDGVSHTLQGLRVHLRLGEVENDDRLLARHA